MDRPRVLVIEDKPSVLELMTTILRDGYDVATASDGATALSVLATAPLDVVLTDIRMPGVSGFDVLRAARSRTPCAEVVMMTAYANVQDAVAAIKLGAYDYVAKPLEADEISLVVARAVEHRREAREEGATRELDEGPARGAALEDVSVCFRRAVEEARDRASRSYLVKLMRLFHGNVTHAAARAGMTRESLHRVLRKYGVRSELHRDEPDDGARPRDPESHAKALSSR